MRDYYIGRNNPKTRECQDCGEPLERGSAMRRGRCRACHQQRLAAMHDLENIREDISDRSQSYFGGTRWLPEIKESRRNPFFYGPTNQNSSLNDDRDLGPLESLEEARSLLRILRREFGGQTLMGQLPEWAAHSDITGLKNWIAQLTGRDIEALNIDRVQQLLNRPQTWI